MALQPGTTLGPYQIESPLGAGGMGEVYKATDTRLDRTVAIKVLPEHVASDPDLKQRFEREARTVAALNHPHICTLHDIGSQDGIDFLVMEYLDGQTVAQRLEKGALPLDQALQIAIDMADALDKAHRQGIVHRDLKPANIMLTKAGAKLLDFGLAKLKPPEQAGGLSALPTQPADLTQQGAILGTFQYMAPEQLEGQEADARTDIFAFGAVVYEMVTGKKAFEGKSQASLITAIMSADPPDLSVSQPLSPLSLDRVGRKCLAKNPDARWQTATDLQDELRWVVERGAEPQSTRQTRTWRLLPWLAVGASVLLATILLTQFRTGDPGLRRTTHRYQVLPGDANVGVFGIAATSGGLTVSPDGRNFVFAATDSDGQRQLWIQPVDQLDARALEGTEGARLPFWSADSREVGYVAQDRFRSVDIATSAIREIGSAPVRGSPGGSWSADGTILFSTSEGISRISASGGTPTPLVHAGAGRGDLRQRWPTFLPDGQHFIFLNITDNEATTGLYIASLDDPEPTFLVASDFSGAYAEPGYLLFVQAGVFLAQPFDAARRELVGDPVPVGDGVPVTLSTRRAEFSASNTGVLVYGARAESAGLAWFDRSGTYLGPFEGTSHAEISPDGRRVVADAVEESGTRDVWIWDLERGGKTRVTSHAANDWVAVWSPDGRRLIFTSNRDDPRARLQLYEASTGSVAGAAELLLDTDETKHHLTWSPDGETLVFESSNPETGWHLWTLPLGGDREPAVFLRTEFQETQPQFSPDGHYLAYASNETSVYQVYLQTFPPGDDRWLVSTTGGVQPRWAQDGRELLYVGADATIMSVSVDPSTPSPTLGVPQPLFKTVLPGDSPAVHFAVTSDGERFLSYSPREQAAFTVVVNWFEELKARVPAGR